MEFWCAVRAFSDLLEAKNRFTRYKKDIIKIYSVVGDKNGHTYYDDSVNKKKLLVVHMGKIKVRTDIKMNSKSTLR